MAKVDIEKLFENATAFIQLAEKLAGGDDSHTKAREMAATMLIASASLARMTHMDEAKFAVGAAKIAHKCWEVRTDLDTLN
jgi:hypothetical protein